MSLLESLPSKYPCPTCGELKCLGLSKKDKPYYFCDYCGVQVFIRGKVGIKNLSLLFDAGVLNHFEETGSLESKFEFIKLESNISFLEQKIEILESKPNNSLSQKRAILTLKSKLRSLEEQLFLKIEEL